MFNYQVALNDTEYKNYKYYLESLRKVKEALAQGFSSKAQQKEALSSLSGAWFEYHQVFSSCAYNLIKNKSRDEIFKMLWNMPDSAYHYKSSKMKEFAEIDEIKDAIQPMEEMKELYDTIKATPITPKVKESAYDKKLKQYKLALSKKDRSKITDEKKYNRGINKIIKSADEFITPFYNDEVTYRIAQLKRKKDATITEDEIKKLFKEMKEMELLDIKYRAMTVIDEDINSVKLTEYHGSLRSWTINGDKLFIIEVISAGGYNIQRLHHRILTHYKKLKK